MFLLAQVFIVLTWASSTYLSALVAVVTPSKVHLGLDIASGATGLPAPPGTAPFRTDRAGYAASATGSSGSTSRNDAPLPRPCDCAVTLPRSSRAAQAL